MENHLSDLVILGRVAVAAALGYAIGFERELRGQDAGDRTFALVALGAAAFTGVAIDAFPTTAERLISGIVTGIGFIGGGLMLRRPEEGVVKGLTTAAAIWSTAAVGVVAGAGRLALAIGCTALVLLALELREIPGIRLLDARRYAASMPPDTHDDPSS
jgi:putative Mg2+ transporter-C (MgtC) family protein